MSELTPRQIVAELDRHIVGQGRAKRMVAIALRNRTRRRRLDPALREEISPKNIILIGPTGVGKTEIARRLARLANAPFVKVEATKYTEVGYVGRDVESMVRDLADRAVSMVKEEKAAEVEEAARARAEDRVLDLLLPPPPGVDWRRDSRGEGEEPAESTDPAQAADSPAQRYRRSRDKMRARLREGSLDEREVEIEVRRQAKVQVMGPMGMGGFTGGVDDASGDLRSMIENMFPGKPRPTRVTVHEAVGILTAEAVEELLDMDKITREALERAQEAGIIFVDEIDKIAGRSHGQGPDVSREGVQRDILPIVEGCLVNTKHGPVRTDHILFIAAGAFHISKPGDLIPELQGRFPLRVELEALSTEDFRRILTEPETALTRQYQALLHTDGVEIEFSDDGIAEIAHSAFRANEQAENIGARRLHTVLEKVLEDVAFEAGDSAPPRLVIDAAYVRDHLAEVFKDQNLSRYIL